MLKKIVYGAAVVWTITIAVLCLIKFGNLPSLGVSSIDKYVHFAFHFIFISLWGYHNWLSYRLINLNFLLKAVVVSLLYGILIEILQETCTTTRHADIYDVLANLSGAIASFICFFIIKAKSDRSKA